MRNKKDNILIAKFIGAYLIDFKEKDGSISKNWMTKGNPLYGGQSIKGNSINQLRFHKSWDWLMPVVDKIENGFHWNHEIHIHNGHCMITNFMDNKIFMGSKINATYNAIIEFIKWYNKHQ